MPGWGHWPRVDGVPNMATLSTHWLSTWNQSKSQHNSTNINLIISYHEGHSGALLGWTIRAKKNCSFQNELNQLFLNLAKNDLVDISEQGIKYSLDNVMAI